MLKKLISFKVIYYLRGAPPSVAPFLYNHMFDNAVQHPPVYETKIQQGGDLLWFGL